jgi:hypothetical protein
VDDVEENIALNTLGTIIHETLKVMLEPYIGVPLTTSHVKDCIAGISDEVHTQFRLVYKEGDIRKGRNLLAFEVAKRNIHNFFKAELSNIENGDLVKIIALEQTFERVLEHPSLPFPVNIKGNIDRIEERNGVIRIVDYKTGKVESRDMVLKSWDALIADIKNEKIIQVLAYAFLFGSTEKPIQAGIISFKNMKSGFLPFVLVHEKIEKSYLDSTIVSSYLEQLVLLLNEIFDREIPLTEKVD